MKYDKINDNVGFIDSSHEYTDLEDNIKYVSVTTLIHKFCQEYDESFWSFYKALEKLLRPEEFSSIKSGLLNTKKVDFQIVESFGLDISKVESTRQEIISEWHITRDVSCERGTNIHLEKELEYYNSAEPKVKYYDLGGKFECKKDYFKLDLERGIYPEFLISRKTADGVLRIAGQIDLLIKDGNDIYIVDYKGLSLDTPIATTTGWKLINDISINDIIFDRDGNTTKVEHVSEIHNNPCYKITFDNNDTIICDHEHKWIISFRRKVNNYIEKEMTTDEIFNHCNSKKRSSYNILKIKNCESLNLPNIDLPIDPYVLGTWLGDGSKACGVITNININLWNEIKNRGYEIGNDISGDNKAEMRTILGIRGELNKLGLLNNKHIPNIYLRASHNQRLDLLRGFMDTDGYFNNKRKRFVMATTQLWQAEDIVKLVSSLGWKPTLIKATKYCNGKKFQGYDVCFKAFENPFLIRNQDCLSQLSLRECDSKYRTIEKIERIDTVKTRCIAVDSPSHTYLAGYSLIPTHNTNKKLDEKSYFDPKARKHTMMKFPLNNLMDCHMMHYTLQLSLYAYLLQLNNPEFNIKSLKIIHYDHKGNEKHYDLEYKKEDIERLLIFYKKETILNARKEKRKPIEY